MGSCSVTGARNCRTAIIDAVCMPLDPLGDTRAVVVDVQEVTATWLRVTLKKTAKISGLAELYLN